jgi:hypothetical protein
VKLEWILLAEGVGAAANGALTAIGLNQNVLIAPRFPALTKRAVIAHFSSSKPFEDGELTVSFSVTSPTGKVVSANTAKINLSGGIIAWPDLPAAFDVPVELVIPVSEYGEHCITISASFPDGSKGDGTLALYVVPGLPTETSATSG